MNKINKIAVIGGTGKSGKYLVSLLLEKGYHFKLLVRNPSIFPISNSLIEVVEGDARDYDSIYKLLTDCQAVISTLGQPKNESPIFSQATGNVLKAMTELGINRYILTTGLNVDTPYDKKSPHSQFATKWMKSNYPDTTIDKQAEYDLLKISNVNWTLVRLPLIEQTDAQNGVKASLEDCPGDKISSTDLAYFLVNQLEDKIYFKSSPFIANA